MKKFKQILAIITIVLLAGLYIATLVLAIIGNEHTNGWFMACIFATIVVPIIMWVIQWLYKMVKKKASENPVQPKEEANDEQR